MNIAMKPVMIGITGNPGGGKSTVMEILRSLNFPTIKADSVAKEVIYVEKYYSKLEEIFNTSILTEDGNLDFKKITDLFFMVNDEGERIRSLMYRYFHHPVWTEVDRRAKASGKLFVFVENAVLFEQEWKSHFNCVVCVYCSEEEATRRIEANRNWPLERLNNIREIQIRTADKIKLSGAVIDTTHIPLFNMKDRVKELIKELGIKLPSRFS